jgi:tRNA(Ile)-lysidine synthase
MSQELEFQRILEKYRLVDRGNHILLAVSGGADSVALLRFFCAVKDDWHLNLSVFHLNHQFRGRDADEDQLFVENLCLHHRIRCYSHSEDVLSFSSERGLSFETAARERRYALMDQIFMEQGCDKIALAHHLNDQVETFFQRLTRGSGIDGLTGMEWQREGRYIRPLLQMTRVDIETYLTLIQQPYCIDETNMDVVYMRNRVRHELIPYLERYFNGNAVKRIGHTMSLLQMDKDYLDFETDRFINQNSKPRGKGFSVELTAMATCHQAILQRALRSLFLKVKGSLQGFEASHVGEIMDLVSRKRQGSLKTYQGVVFEIAYDELVVRGVSEMPESTAYTYWLTDEEPLLLVEAGLKLTLTCHLKKTISGHLRPDLYLIAADHLRLPLEVRSRRPGDQLLKKGLEGHKTIKDIFREQRIPVCDRGRLPVIACADEIIWVPFGVLAAPFYVTSETEQVYVLSVEKL